MPDHMSIGELADKTGVSSRTIRYYEELGILPKPPRSEGGTRRYPPEYQFYVEGAVALKELGFSLDEIKSIGRLALGRPMTETQHRRAAKSLHQKMELLEHKVEVLSRLRDILKEREALEDEREDEARDIQRLATILEPVNGQKRTA